VQVEHRRDIDGLRSLAVLAVILFHAKVPYFDGGFLGVDIFFVISGFLITKIICGELENRNFSILRFYERRARRILPALFFVILISLAVFYLVLIPDDLKMLGQSVVATIAFSNNVLLYMTSGYFEPSVDLKPMAHTWSLGVEEQYYFLVPLALIGAHKFGGRKGVISVLSLLTLISLVFTIWISRENKNFNFFLLFSRFWELGAGSLAALTIASVSSLNQRNKDILALGGVLFIVASIFLLGKQHSNPNEWTVLPVLGTCFVLWFSRPNTLTWGILANPVMVFIGLISYSLYLWHQPLFVYLRISSLEQPRAVDYVPYIALAVLLAYFSWRFVEAPFRVKEKISRWQLVGVLGVASLALGVIGLVFHLTSGFQARWPELNDGSLGSGQSKAYNLSAGRFADKQLSELDRDHNVLVIGNSFARDIINVLNEDATLSKLNISYSEVSPCDEANLKSETEALARHARYVIFGSGVGINNETTQCIENAIKILSTNTAHDYIIFGTKNFGWNNNAVMMLSQDIRYTYRTKVRDEVLLDNASGRASFGPDVYVDLIDAMGGTVDGRVPVFTPDRKFISQDREHLTRAGAQYLGQLIGKTRALAKLVAIAQDIPQKSR
jgi:peptidoglycan/LPS O-acetylase OafA/YrhL